MPKGELDPTLQQLDRRIERRYRQPIGTNPAVLCPKTIAGGEISHWRDIPDVLARRLKSHWKHLTDDREQQIDEATKLADFLNNTAAEVRRVLGREAVAQDGREPTKC